MGMTPLEIALINAWWRLSDHVRLDRAERARREARLTTSTMTRPWRAWCVAIRASDTRIHKYTALIRPYNDINDYGLPHSVEMDAEEIAAMVKPVLLDWPGVTVAKAAASLGRSPQTIFKWIKNGEVFSEVKRVCATPLGSFGKPRPLVWAHRRMDPAGVHGKAPNDYLSGMWLAHWERIPPDAELFAERVPRERGCGGGWQWICPGLRGKKCGRSVDKLYLPVPVWTLGRYLDHDWRTGNRRSADEPTAKTDAAAVPTAPSPIPTEQDTESADHPAQGDSGAAAPRPQFACSNCHRVQCISMTTSAGWNLLVSVMSDGLLYGHDVPKTREILEDLDLTRRCRPSIRKDAVIRRARVMQLLRRGWGPKRIARAMGVAHTTAVRHTTAVCAAEGVKGVVALYHKWGVRRVPRRHKAPRSALVLKLMLAGWKDREIGEHMGTNRRAVSKLVQFLCKRHRVRSRHQLKAKFQKASQLAVA